MKFHEDIKKFIFCAFRFVEFDECILFHSLHVNKVGLYSCSFQYEHRSFYFSLFQQRYHQQICVW